MEYNTYGLEFARSVINNPHPYYLRARDKHPEPDLEWIERTLANPYITTVDDAHPGRLAFYRYIPEAGAGKWLLVVVQDAQLFNAYFNRDLLKSWGRPE